MSAVPAARDRLIERHMPLARSLAHRYSRAAEPMADLEQVAYLALVKAVDGYDPDRGTAFSSYAVPYILGAIKRHFRDCVWPVHVPRGAKDLVQEVERLSDEAWTATGRSPTAAELARMAGTSIEAVLDAREAAKALYCAALDELVHDAEPGSESNLDRLVSDDPGFSDALERYAMDSALAELNPRQRLVVALYFRADLTQSEIAGLLGYSQMHVSRLLRQAIERLESELTSERRR